MEVLDYPLKENCQNIFVTWCHPRLLQQVISALKIWSTFGILRRGLGTRSSGLLFLFSRLFTCVLAQAKRTLGVDDRLAVAEYRVAFCWLSINDDCLHSYILRIYATTWNILPLKLSNVDWKHFYFVNHIAYLSPLLSWQTDILLDFIYCMYFTFCILIA